MLCALFSPAQHTNLTFRWFSCSDPSHQSCARLLHRRTSCGGQRRNVHQQSMRRTGSLWRRYWAVRTATGHLARPLSRLKWIHRGNGVLFLLRSYILYKHLHYYYYYYYYYYYLQLFDNYDNYDNYNWAYWTKRRQTRHRRAMVWRHAETLLGEGSVFLKGQFTQHSLRARALEFPRFRVVKLSFNRRCISPNPRSLSLLLL